MGESSRTIGDRGERLFGHLASKWRAEWLRTGSQPSFDGELSWTDLPGVVLPVQIKTRLTMDTGWTNCPVYIRKARTLQDWSIRPPILVICVLEDGTAFWLDTADQLPRPHPSTFTFHVPRTQPVSENTTGEIRRSALARPRVDAPYVDQTKALRRFGMLYQWRPGLPKRMDSPSTLMGLITNAYREMGEVNVNNRDAVALAVARLLVGSGPVLRELNAEPLLEVVSNRLLSSALGGRSFTLGALVALLQPSAQARVGHDSIPILVNAAELAIDRRSFLNPEFGLIILAELSDRFRDVSLPREALSELTQRVRRDPQNRRVLRVARVLENWLSAPCPLQQLFSSEWLNRAIYRPLPSMSPALVDPEGVSAVVSHVLIQGLSGSSARDLKLADQFIRLRAGDILARWLQ